MQFVYKKNHQIVQYFFCGKCVYFLRYVVGIIQKIEKSKEMQLLQHMRKMYVQNQLKKNVNTRSGGRYANLRCHGLPNS